MRHDLIHWHSVATHAIDAPARIVLSRHLGVSLLVASRHLGISLPAAHRPSPIGMSEEPAKSIRVAHDVATIGSHRAHGTTESRHSAWALVSLRDSVVSIFLAKVRQRGSEVEPGGLLAVPYESHDGVELLLSVRAARDVATLGSHIVHGTTDSRLSTA